MHTLATPLLLIYLAVIGVVCVYGFHRYWMVFTCLRHSRQRSSTPPSRFERLPRVTVQLPMYNERRVAERVIEAACAIDYPRELLQVQVLDDSTDDSAAITRRACQRLAGEGHNVEYLHRTNRRGYKAGALAHGLSSATGEFIAIFDADFVPPRDILHNTVHHFADPTIGMVQTRWSHLNRDDSLLTQVQAMYLDGHFVVEQTARAATGRWFNFNGTAGVWRRATIDDAGGWQHDTLTEDTDLSYRAQLRGWNFTYLPDVCCPAELPPTVSAFLSQQHRWNKGLIQTAMKLLPTILCSPAPLRTRLEAWFHLTSPIMHVVILLLVLLVLPGMFVPVPIDDISPYASISLGVGFMVLGALAASAFYIASQQMQGRGFWSTLVRLPALMALGVGISVVNSRAVLEAVLRHHSPFVRTPKYNGSRVGDLDPLAASSRKWLPQGVMETALGCLMTACAALSMLESHTLVATPFLLLFACGYLSVGSGAMQRCTEPTVAPDEAPLAVSTQAD